MDLNKESRKGTFLDRSWRDDQKNVLEDTELTKWEKFKAGGYTIKNVAERATNDLSRQQKTCQYLS